jgi:hypothetical protein
LFAAIDILQTFAHRPAAVSLAEIGILALAAAIPLMYVTSLSAMARTAHAVAVGLTIVVILAGMAARFSGSSNWFEPTWPDWLVWAAIVTVSLLALLDRENCSSVAALYLLTLALLGMELFERGFDSVHVFVWASLCELTGVLLIAALIGWALPRLPAGKRLARLPDSRAIACGRRFRIAQAVLFGIAVADTLWIITDLRFDGMGTGKALLGLTGRRAGCPAALMLLGTAIVMAWQSPPSARTAWQCVAFFIGLLFTTSIGWSGPVTTHSGGGLWLHWSKTLWITASMMTLMSSAGLARVFPTKAEWLASGRRVAPVFACVAAIALAVRWFAP